MKRTLCILLIVIMTMTLLAGCGQPAPTPAPAAPAEAAPAEAAPTEAAPAEEAPEMPKINWVFSAMNAADHPGVITAQAMADAITERTNGNWTFSFHPGGTLAGEADAVEMTRTGTISWIQTTSTYMELYDARIGALGLPYLFRTWEDMRNFTKDSDYMKAVWADLEKNTGLKYLDSLNIGSRQLVTVGIDPIKCPDDLNGVKIRSQQPESRQNMVAALGATPVPMSLDEVYIAMQTGVIQGQENPITTIYVSKFYEVTDDLYKTEHNYGEMAYFVNADAFNALPEEYKQIWNEEWEKMLTSFEGMIEASEKEAEDVLKANGVRIWEQSDLDMQAFYDSAARMIDEKYMSNAEYAELVNAVNEYCGY